MFGLRARCLVLWGMVLLRLWQSPLHPVTGTAGHMVVLSSQNATQCHKIHFDCGMVRDTMQEPV